MVMCRRVSPLEEQDELDEGFLKTENGEYLSLRNCSKEIEGSLESFAPFVEQDKLMDGLIRMERTGEYVPVDSLKEIGFEQEEGCFIATQVYGGIQKPQVQILRDFRDNVLMQKKVGRSFIQIYYGGLGKRIANFVRKQMPSTMPLIRKGLDFLVDRYSKNR